MGKKNKILIVDDDVQFVDTVKTLLESVGYEVDFSYESAKGLKKAQEKKPDLIILDVMFAGKPGPDGFEVSRQLKQDQTLKDIPVLIISGVRKVLDLKWDYEPDDTWMPVKKFLEKPIKPEKLLEEIKKIIGA